MCGWDVCSFWKLKVFLPSQSALLHILKDPDFSLLFPPLTPRLPVPLWICTGVGGGVPGIGSGGQGAGGWGLGSVHTCLQKVIGSFRGSILLGHPLAVWDAQTVSATSGSW